MIKDLRDIQKRIVKGCKYVVYVAKNDPQVLIKARTLALAYMVAASAIYGTYSMLVAPSEKKQSNSQSAYQELQNSNPLSVSDILANALLKLKKEDQELKERASLLQFQDKLYREERQKFGNEKKFNNVIMALIPGAPKVIKQGAVSITSLPPAEDEGYAVYPVSIAGESTYKALSAYLEFLESRPEIGSLDEMRIETSDTAQLGETPLLQYSIKVGRIAAR